MFGAGGEYHPRVLHAGDPSGEGGEDPQRLPPATPPRGQAGWTKSLRSIKICSAAPSELI